MANLVVTGGLGFIGQHLVKKLRNLGHTVYIIDLKYKPDPIDLSSYTDTKRHFEEITDHKSKIIDCVFDLATLPLTLSIKEPYETYHKIVCMATVLCELLRERYFKNLIHISSSEVYGTAKNIPMWEYHPMMPQSPYAAAKASQDMLMISYNRTYQSQIAIARPFNAYGEGQDLNAIIPSAIKHILKGESPIIEGDGSQVRDFIYVGDIVRGIVEIYNRKELCYGRIFNLVGKNLVSISDLVGMICDLMGYKGGAIYTDKRKGNVDILCGSGYFAEFILGFKPKVTLIEGLKRTIEWWKKQDFTL